MRRRKILHYFGYLVRIMTTAMTVLILLAGCGKSEPTATPLPAAATQVALEPTCTPPPPTETPPTPTETAVPPTNTPLPPTATPVPPTETPLPPTETPQPTPTLDPTVFQLRSPVFGLEETIPSRYTCKGEDISPPLEWGAPPSGTQSLVLIVDDISAGNLTHWLLFNIPPSTRSMSEAVPTQGRFEDGRRQGTNQTLALGYFGPCPLPGPNRYRFRLYALDTMLDLEEGVMRIPLKEAMRGHILAETETIGVFP
jgi:Raf kinase inhibitor-like YbhB/YbcL family protein